MGERPPAAYHMDRRPLGREGDARLGGRTTRRIERPGEGLGERAERVGDFGEDDHRRGRETELSGGRSDESGAGVSRLRGEGQVQAEGIPVVVMFWSYQSEREGRKGSPVCRGQDVGDRWEVSS